MSGALTVVAIMFCRRCHGLLFVTVLPESSCGSAFFVVMVVVTDLVDYVAGYTLRCCRPLLLSGSLVVVKDGWLLLIVVCAVVMVCCCC